MYTCASLCQMQTVTNGSFWVLMVIWGSGAGLFNALLTLLPQIVCPFGYSDVRALKTLGYSGLTVCVCVCRLTQGCGVP